MEQHGTRATDDARRLDLAPVTIAVDGEAFTLSVGSEGIAVRQGVDRSAPRITLNRSAFSDLMNERRTALGLVIGGRTDGDPQANALLCAWDPVLRSVIDGRGVYRSGDIDLCASDGSPLNLHQRFRLDEDTASSANFLREAGYMLIERVCTQSEMDAIDADLDRAVADAHVDDGASWWASTRSGDSYPCRLLGFTAASPALRDLIADTRFLAIGDLLGEGHTPGDPFGEHFSSVTAEALIKRVDSVDGFVCLPWHKDCDRGGHSMFCSGLTIGICLTPVDAAHGGLDVVAGSHRANIARVQAERGLDLPTVSLSAQRGDVTVHMSCALHRSTHPTTHERRVAYTGFTLPARPGDVPTNDLQATLQSERAAIGVAKTSSARLSSTERARPHA